MSTVFAFLAGSEIIGFETGIFCAYCLTGPLISRTNFVTVDFSQTVFS